MAYFGKNGVWACFSFDGTNTSTIYDSHNVSSIGDETTGTYRVNFSNNTPNTNYCVVGLNQRKSGNSDVRMFAYDHTGPYNHYSTDGFQFRMMHYTNVSAAETTLCNGFVLEN